MDTSSIASVITGLLKQYLSGGQQQGTAPTTGQAAPAVGNPEKVQDLHALVSNTLQAHPEAAQTLQSFQQAPEQHADKLKNVLDQHLSNNPGFLQQAIEHLKQIHPDLAQGSLADKAEGFISSLFGKKAA